MAHLRMVTVLLILEQICWQAKAVHSVYWKVSASILYSQGGYYLFRLAGNSAQMSSAQNILNLVLQMKYL